MDSQDLVTEEEAIKILEKDVSRHKQILFKTVYNF